MTQTSFEYRALDKRGVTTRGYTSALTREEAFRKIAAAGLTPVRIRRIKAKRQGWRRKKITSRDVAHFTYQLSVLIEARIPISDGLTTIAEQEPNREFARIIEDISRRISAGDTITDSLIAHKKVFGEVYIETLRAAEKSGNLVHILGHLSDMLEQQEVTSRQVKSAMMYPIMVMSALTLAIIFLMLFVVPRFAQMFAERGVELPLPTRILISVSDFIKMFWWLLLGVGVGIFFALRAMWATSRGREKIDKFLHRIPYLKRILIALGVSRFSHVFGLSLGAGLSLIDCLELSGRVSGRPLLRMDTEKMIDQVKNGGRLSQVLMACNYIPGFAKRMIAAGEESAEMPKMCGIVTRHYRREVEFLTKNIGAAIEPILVFGMAGMVLCVALAIFLPMWNMVALVE